MTCANPIRSRDRRGVTTIPAGVPPLVARLRAIWESQREAIIEIFPKAPGLPADKDAYMKFVEDIYESDAYHSLSIEGYSVTPELIDRVREGSWNPEIDEEDRKNRDALAARGYYLAFQKVKESVAAIINGEPAGALTRDTHREWYRELFAPSVTAGILTASALAGYRNQPVYLRGSQHIPPRTEAVADGMIELFDLLEAEKEASVRAVLGHWLVGYVHPLSGRQWPHGAVSHECHAGVRRLSLDGSQGGRPQGLSGGAGGGERQHECEAVCRVPGGAGEVVYRSKRLTRVSFC